MDTTTTITILSIIVAAIGGKEAWTYYKKRLEVKAKLTMHGSGNEAELRKEIKEMLGSQISDLKEQVKLLTGRIKVLEEERERDKKRIANQEIRIGILSERLGKKLSSTGKGKRGSVDDSFDDISTVD